MHTYIQELKADFSGLLRAYASILFAKSPWIGGVFLWATFWYPNAGTSGLLAAIAGIITARLLQFRNLKSGLHVYNSLLVGLSLGAYYQLDMHLAVLIVFAAILAVFVTVAMADMAWKLNRLPALSMPFVLVALMGTLAAQSYGTLSRYLLPLTPNEVLVSPLVDQFLTALGSAFFTPNPLAGLLMFLGLVVTSRYLALLAVAGFLAGFSAYTFLSGSPHPDLVAWNGFNFILVAMALGGVFTVPSWQSFVLAMLAAVITALVTASSETFMLVYGLPVMALPFLFTTMTILLALTNRPASKALQLTLEAPDLPEKSFERARLATARHGEFGSVPVLPPFYGAWQVYQGFDGAHTHKAPWQHALDFYIVEQKQSYRSHGTILDDYYCFGLPIVSPVEGYVVKALDVLVDNQPGQVDTENNWGNYILIRMANGLYVLLAHLKQASLEVEEGAYVVVGTTLARCGNSGRSPQPHLHLHVQWGETLGGATHPFHIATVLHQHLKGGSVAFKLFVRPKEGESIIASKSDVGLRESLNLMVGRSLTYQVQLQGAEQTRTLHVALNLLGQLRLEADSGASVAFTAQDNLLAFYDRQGAEDAFLDTWLLAIGLTPLHQGALQWRDQPSMALFPLSTKQKLLSAVCKPLGGGLASSYQRAWQGEQWLQLGEHQLSLLAGVVLHVSSRVEIKPKLGCVRFQLVGDAYRCEAKLLALGQKGDAGIPAWHIHADTQEQDEGGSHEV